MLDIKKRVYLGVGHGGNDPGAVANGYKESEINLTTAIACGDYLLANNVDAKLSRYANLGTTSINAKASEANAWNADLVVEIHYNAGGGDGGEVYYRTGDETSKTLAKNILTELIGIGQNSRGLKTKLTFDGRDYFGMIRIPKAPAVLVECAFLDNKKDMEIADTPGEQKTMGVAIAKGILKTLFIDVDKSIKIGSIVTIDPGSLYGGLSTSRGKIVPHNQLSPKKHTVAAVATHHGVKEARLKEINSWVAVKSLKV